MSSETTVFTKIINRELPAEIVRETDTVIVIKTIEPRAPVHLLGITKEPIPHLHALLQNEENRDLLWELFRVLSEVADELGLSERGYRLTTNIGSEGGQKVPHLHVHLLGGKPLAE